MRTTAAPPEPRVPQDARYDRIGVGYARQRREDPHLAAILRRALGNARDVVNVGAGAGSYEPTDLHVIAVEPSAVMVAQRPPGRPAVRGVATDLPLHDKSVDAAMTVLSLHHWHPGQEAGVRQMCRVSRGPVVIVTIDPGPSGEMWLMADYLHEVRTMDHRIFPPIDTIVSWLDRPATVTVVPTRRDTPDRNLLAFWAHPEWVLDPAARAATSGFSRQPAEVVDRVVKDVRADLASGAWDSRHGHLRQLEALDCGLRVICAE